MSISASIDFKLHQKNDALTNLDVIELLFKNDWSFNDHGLKSFVPFGAEIGDFESKNMTDEEVLTLLKAKEEIGENLSVVMTWKNTNIGFTLVSFEEAKFSLLLNVNRQMTIYNVTGFLGI